MSHDAIAVLQLLHRVALSNDVFQVGKCGIAHEVSHDAIAVLQLLHRLE